ncbi:hypothetical protein M409DRAFT_17276 [Zasmidium cellare ATCC 36951]|uniref:RNA polymerase I-specific transcription initiation factor RRN6-like protein n=1 Tax=Zasmidium cellare ATCC 36951 TaxID=1080233 RepID=A0A6A6D6Q3_ZASCE|nr:uncharacterized protein M409DRAFT_17276 [Zasmidium cellare ATCC 36951]KAF2173336.1 hypothetical protein M409DRAFT_17276 [Zasmidium cellare ATCC 36951]
MAERSKCDLPYGHYGRVQISLDDNNLQFGRTLTAPLYIKALDSPHILRQASDTLVPQDATTNPKNSTVGLAKQAQALVEHYPEFQPALDHLPPLLKTSEAVQKAAGRYEPTKGRLIAFTKVWSDIRHRTFSVAVIAAGQTGSELRLVQVQRQRRGWTADRASWIEVPTLHGEEARWSSNDGPILQVYSMPNASSRDALIAIRTQSKTHIFRPSHSKSSQESALSNLTLSLLHTVGIDQTGGKMHADVAFNPDFGQQLAMVEDAGAWSILEFSSRRMDRVSRSWHGLVQSKHSTRTFTLRDGWARIAWILNLSTLVTCTRQSLRLVSLKADGGAMSREIDPDLFDTQVPILDLIVMPGVKDSFAVLTRTHIVLYQVTVKSPDEVVATCYAKIRHFKSSEDLSLRLSSWVDQDDVFLALLSSLPSPMCVFWLRLDGKDVAIHDGPFELVLSGAHSLRDLHVQPLEMVSKPISSADPHRHADHVRHYSFIALRADYSIFEGICYGLPTQRSPNYQLPTAPLWEQKFGPATQSRLWRERFVVEDSDSLLEPDQQRPEPVSRRARKPKALLSAKEKPTSFELVAGVLSQPLGPDKSIEDLASEVSAALRNKNIENAGPMRTLHSFAKAEIATNDVGEASALLQNTFKTADHGAEIDDEPGDRDHGRDLRLKVESGQSFGFFLPEDQVTDSKATLASVHDHFISNWVTPLSSNVPGWVRLAKANLAQRMAAEVFLATQRLRLQEIKAPVSQEIQEESQAQEQTWDLPLRASGPIAQTLPTSSRTARYLSQNSALPTPSPTATPSVITASSGSSLTAAPELHRLSKYTVFAKPAPMVLPRPLVKVLSHWDVGKDPDDYDWLSPSRHLTQQEDNDAENDLTERERKRLQRRAERHILRQRKEAAASQASQMTSSQATEIMSASQPAVLKVESQPSGIPASSQSQGPSIGPAAASQVVPGRFGGRPPPKKRRKQGF